MIPASQMGQNPGLRILILNWRDLAHPKAGGAEVYTHNVANEWIKTGHDVTLFCAAVDGRPEYDEIDGLHIIRRGSQFGVYREAKRYYRNEGRGKFDLVVDEVNTRPFLAPKWVDDAPVIALIHQVCRELWFYQMPLPVAIAGRYWLEPRWLRAYRDVLTLTVSESSRLSLESYGLNLVNVVPQGHNFLRERPNVLREVRPTIVYVGRLEAHKRPDEAILAFSLLREALPNAAMWVIGSGPMEERLRRTAPAEVEFLGKVSEDEKVARLARAHVLVVTSVREGWGLVVTEAAEVGTRSITYDVPGLRDSVKASEGILTGSNPEQLSSVLRQSLSNWRVSQLPEVSPGGVIPWDQVATRILNLAKASKFDRIARLSNQDM